MNRREFLFASAALIGSGLYPPNPSNVFRLGFGSCALQHEAQPIWQSVLRDKPNLFLFLGDNVYGDTEDMKYLNEQYQRWSREPNFARFRARVPLVATWDDHDFGRNDAGREFPEKQTSKNIFLDFFNEPLLSDRRMRPGVYTSYEIPVGPLKLQLIMLDLRWFRSPLKVDEQGRYIPNPDPRATLLGEEQWSWFESELRKPADLRVIASSIQVLAAEHRYEKWANFPADKQRLINLIDELDLNNCLFLSGDMHYGELTIDQTPGGRPLVDLTSSGLNRYESAAPFPNSKRLAVYDQSANYGFIEIDPHAPKPFLVSVKDQWGQTQIIYTMGTNTDATAS